MEKGTPEEINAYLANLRGDTKIEDYVFPEGTNKEITGKIAKVLFDNGMPKALANKIISGYAGIEKEVVTQRFSKDGMETILKDSFGKDGEDYKKTAGETANVLAKHLSEDDRKALEKIPNEHLGLVYRLANNFIKAYGIKEGAASEAGAGSAGKGNVEETRKAIRAKITELSKRSHTAEEKANLVAQLEATYKK